MNRTTHQARQALRWIKDFVPRMLNGYEPVAARAFLASIFAALAIGGIGTGELPPWAEMLLALATILVPFVLGLLARAKVSPVAAIPEQPEFDDEDDDLDLAPVDPAVRDLSAGDADDVPPEPGQHRRED